MTSIHRDGRDMPQLQSIDEYVEVPEPLEETVSIPVETLMSESRWEMEKGTADLRDIKMYDEDAQRMSTSGCGYHRTGRNLTVQSVVMMMQTKSGPTLRNNRLLSERQKNRKIGARMRCTTAARWVAGKTLETENATKGEHLEEWCTSSTLARRRGR